MRSRSTEVNVPSPLPISKLHIIKDKLSVAIEGDVCISSDMHPATVSATSEDREAVQDSPGTVVEPASEVVTHSQQSTKEENDPIPGGAGLATPTTLGSQPSEPRVSKPASGVPGEGRLKTLGFSDNVINRIGKSRTSSTRKY